MGDADRRGSHLLATALEMERKGGAFYEKAASDCTNALGKDIFRVLAEQEAVHAERIRAIQESLGPGKSWPAGLEAVPRQGDVDAVFCAMAIEHGPEAVASAGDLEALEAGIRLEERSISYYGNATSEATDGGEKLFLERMVSEEKGHWAVLTDMKAYFTDPAAWFGGRERSGLDGG